MKNIKKCTKCNIIKNFVVLYNPNSIISYCDLRFGDGGVYTKIGMNQLGNTSPNYFYIKENKVLSRYQCMKSKLKNKIPMFLSKLTEHNNMAINEYTKVYDLGNAKFVWIKD